MSEPRARRAQNQLSVSLEAQGRPTGPVLAHLMQFGQWALEEASFDLLAGNVTPQTLRELADGLEQLGCMIRAYTLSDDDQA